MRLAVRIKNARERINPHSTSSVLALYTFNGNSLFEICVQRHGRRDVAGSFKDIDPAVFETFKALHIKKAECDKGRECALVWSGGN